MRYLQYVHQKLTVMAYKIKVDLYEVTVKESLDKI